MSNHNVHFGEHVLLALKIRNMTLEDLSDRITSRSYTELERMVENEHRPPSEVVQEIARACGCKDVRDFLNIKNMKAA